MSSVRKIKEQLDGRGKFVKVPPSDSDDSATAADMPDLEGGGEYRAAAWDDGDSPSSALTASAGPAAGQVRYYKVWPGKNRFCCRGRIMTGPWSDLPFNGCAWTTIAIPSFLYFRFAAPVLWEHWGPGYPIFCAYALASTIVSLSLTSCTDPGYIRRQPQQGPEPAAEDGTAPQRNMYGRTPPQQVTIDTSLGRSTFTWCRTCELWRPPKSHHCTDCGQCVLGFDHHCPFVNNCVGVRNHVYFLTFLGSVVWLGSTVMLGTMMAMDRALRHPRPRPPTARSAQALLPAQRP